MTDVNENPLSVSDAIQTERWGDWISVGVGTAIAILLLAQRKLSGDVYWDLAAGRWMWQHHAVLMVNQLSWNHDHIRWINIEWLWGIIVYGASQEGAIGLVMLSAIGAFFYFWGIKALSREFALNSPATFAVIVYGVWASAPFWDFRPQTWAYAAAVWSFWLIRRIDRAVLPKRRYLLYVALMALLAIWAQFHGSWILLPAWEFVEVVVGKRRLEWLILLPVTFWIASWGPFGWAGVRHALFLAGSSRIANAIGEWSSPSFHNIYQATVMLIYLFGGALALKRPGIRVKNWIYWMGFGIAGLYAVRFYPYLPLGLIWAFNGLQWPGKIGWRVRTAGVLIGVFAIGWAFGADPLYGNLIDGPFVSRQLEPVAAVQYMKAHRLVRRVFNMYSWGGYLTYVGIPDWIDGRADFWLQVSRDFQAYLAARTGSASPVALIDRSRADVALVRRGTSFYWSLHQSSWRLVYQDHVAAVFVRPSNTSYSKGTTP